jgi:hypothetical protein
MITVPEATKKIIERSRYLSEAISKGIINCSSLARYIRPEIESMLAKKVSNASIVMALNRLEPELQPKFQHNNIFKTPPEIIAHSSLFIVVLPNSEAQGLSLFISRDAGPRSVFIKNQGIHESSFILSQDLFNKYKNTIESKNPLFVKEKISAITIYLPKEAVETSGIYYFFLKSLAWEGVNILELVSTLSELTIIIDDKDSERAFRIIKSLFTT